MCLYEVKITLMDFKSYVVYISAENAVEALIRASVQIEDDIYSVTVKQKGPKEERHDCPRWAEMSWLEQLELAMGEF